ncbi:MAG: hypothetical protein AAF639_45375, partial [Chloroflexota bacterium]
VGKFWGQVNSDVDEWVYMLKNSKVEPEFKSEHIQTASKKLAYMALDKEKRREYEHFMDNESYHNSMMWSKLREGVYQGRQEEKRDVIRNSLVQGISVESIAAITQLDIDEVIQIQKQLEASQQD